VVYCRLSDMMVQVEYSVWSKKLEEYASRDGVEQHAL
jgi:hypothetical protein